MKSRQKFYWQITLGKRKQENNLSSQGIATSVTYLGNPCFVTLLSKNVKSLWMNFRITGTTMNTLYFILSYQLQCNVVVSIEFSPVIWHNLYRANRYKFAVRNSSANSRNWQSSKILDIKRKLNKIFKKS